MKNLFTYLLLLSSFPLFSQQTLNRYLMHQNMKRDYIVYVPASYTGNEAVPLVLNFHGYTSNAQAQMAYGDFRPIADTANFIIVHPQGLMYNGSTHWNVGGWIIGSPADDVGFTAALIDTLAAHYHIDQNRVYATGMSNGGYMSFLLACQLSEKITAIASVTGSMTPETFRDCNPQHPMPVMQIHGTMDGTVPYQGAIWTRSIADVMDFWVQFDHCDMTADTTAFPNINLLDGSTAEHLVYGNGDHGATVEHIKVVGGGHTWPQTGLAFPGTNRDFDASLEIWKFFSSYDLHSLSNSTGLEMETSPFRIYPNPAQTKVCIDVGADRNLSYQLIGLEGKSLLSGHVLGEKHEIDVSSLADGMYFLLVGERQFPIVKGP